MTSGLIQWANEDHPGFDRIAAIENASLDDHDLYIVLQATDYSENSTSPLALRIHLEDLVIRSTSDPVCTPERKESVRIKVTPVEDIPAEARPIPLRTVKLNSKVTPEEVLDRLPDDIQLVVLNYSWKHEGMEIATGASYQEPYGDPTLLLVLPRTGGKDIAMATRLKENPWKRRPWLILTPAAVAGDVLAFPLYFLVVITGGLC